MIPDNALEAAREIVAAGEDTRDKRQKQVAEWCAAAFGTDHAASIPQRGIRLAEEAIEAAQSAGCDAAMIHKLVDHVFSKEPGHLAQEIGGSGITLLALAQAAGLSADAEEARELARVLAKPLEHFAARNKAKDDAGFNVVAASAGEGTRTLSPTGWREGMRSAPTDGTEILVYRSDAGVFTAWFVSPADHVNGGAQEPSWFTHEGGDLTSEMPTHWMPFPELPTSPSSAGEDTRLLAVMQRPVVASFVRYLAAWPELRFWQAVRSWSRSHGVFTPRTFDDFINAKRIEAGTGMKDTFGITDEAALRAAVAAKGE